MNRAKLPPLKASSKRLTSYELFYLSRKHGVPMRMVVQAETITKAWKELEESLGAEFVKRVKAPRKSVEDIWT